jgi:hypothetical protein
LPKSLRVKLDPVAGGSGEGELRTVVGATVSLVGFGALSTAAKRKEPTPATLRFLARYFSQTKDDQGTEPAKIASLTGSIVLGAQDQPQFVLGNLADAPDTLGLEEPLEDPADPVPSSPARFLVTLDFEGSSFPDQPSFELALPEDANAFHFAEVGVELELDGNLEAGFEQNDLLDVPLSGAQPLVPAFVVTIVDDVGDPVVALEVDFDVGGAVSKKSTDERGVARFYVPDASVATLRLPDVATLRSVLSPRWGLVRNKARLPPSEIRVVLAVRDDMPLDLQLQAGTPATLSLQPRVERARLVKFFFDTNKTFLLPDLPGASQTMKGLYDRNKPSKLLIVGHADAPGGVPYNDKLSQERAETVLAYLKEDVDGWLTWYEAAVLPQKRWGASEDLAMIAAVASANPQAGARDPGEPLIEFFQRTRGLKVDGIAGPNTRRSLVSEYLSLHGAPLPDEIAPTTHGEGEHFPESGRSTPNPDAEDRRVELFFFDAALGIQPAPPQKVPARGSLEYPEWVRRSELIDSLNGGRRSLSLRLLDPMNEPLADAPYELEVESEKRRGRSDDQGFIFEENVPVPSRCTLRWTFPDDPDDPAPVVGSAAQPAPASSDGDATALDPGAAEFLFEREIFLDYSDVDADDPNEAARRRLHNLGYLDDSQSSNLQAFQRDFKLQETGQLDQATQDKLREVHDRV